MSDLLRDALADEAREKEAAAVAEDFTEIQEQDEPGIRVSMPDLSFLAAPTGNGSIDEYIEHPLNFDGRRSTARILRGLTGICGELNYALVDIGLGVIEKIKEKSTNEQLNHPGQ